MVPVEPIARGRVSLVDAIDHLLNRGAVLSGDATLSVAGIDLVYVGLNLIVSSVETLEQRGDWRWGTPARPGSGPGDHPPAVAPGREILEAPEPVESEFSSGRRSLQSLEASEPSRYEIGDLAQAEHPDVNSATSVARLVLTLVELLRQLVERQALRRVEGMSLNDEQIERMGRALKELSEKMAELRDLFGLEEQDLEIDLGPLGRLI